jgi:hypothetical protein
MNLAPWHLGFHWQLAIFSLACGIASYYYPEGWIHWLAYVLFVITVVYMLTKFRLYKQNLWRRKHAQGTQIFAKLAREELAAAKKEQRDVNIPPLYVRLATNLLAPEHSTEFCNSDLLTESGRKEYYQRLVDAYPIVFTSKVKPEYHEQALASIREDIEASQYGHDIVIAVAIEKAYGPVEATRYLLAMASGLTTRNGLFS